MYQKRKETNFDNAGALVSKGHILCEEMLVGAAEARVCDAHQDFIMSNLTLRRSFDNLALFGALEDGERYHILGLGMYMREGKERAAVSCDGRRKD